MKSLNTLVTALCTATSSSIRSGARFHQARKGRSIGAIARLREKIAPDTKRPRDLISAYGEGYALHL
jgi:hypothetical protein